MYCVVRTYKLKHIFFIFFIAIFSCKGPRADVIVAIVVFLQI